MAKPESLSNQLPHPQYRPDIDGLRAVAVLSVVFFHAFPEALKGGFIGVDIFFVISGYLISGILFGSLKRGTFSFRNFYARRILRIFPALIVVLAVCWLIGWLVLLPGDNVSLTSGNLNLNTSSVSSVRNYSLNTGSIGLSGGNISLVGLSGGSISLYGETLTLNGNISAVA